MQISPYSCLFTELDFLNIMSPKYATALSFVLSVSVMIATPEIFGGFSPNAFK